MGYIYLAAPYLCSSEIKRYERYTQVVNVSARFLQKGIHSYAPVIIQHDCMTRHLFPNNDSFWLPFQQEFLLRATSLGIIKLEGWDTSSNVKADIIFATKHNIPIKYIEYPLI